ncbi:MAG: hypothetical protein IPK12_00005, partial [Gemmatimonadetes bacterium]|nr:hypothetical protein [Gemmatimonadota bacterium]
MGSQGGCPQPHAAGPEGIYILAPDAWHLGTVTLPEHVAHFPWGDADLRTLYITAVHYRLRVEPPGT